MVCGGAVLCVQGLESCPESLAHLRVPAGPPGA